MKVRALHTPSRLGRRLLCAALALAGACSKAPDADPGSSAAGPGVPRRIVSLVCAATDIFQALGEMDRLVAVEEDCPCAGTEGMAKIRNEDHPGKAAALNVESVLALRPDAVVAKPDLRPALEGRGFHVVWTLPDLTRDNVADLVGKIGALLRCPERAQALLDRMAEREADLRRRTADLPRVRVYYETTGIGGTVGGPSVVDAMIELAGGRNIAHDVAKAYTTLTPEAIFAADPDVIVLGGYADPVDVVKARPGWDRLKAVREGRVFQIPLARRGVSLATPRCVEECERLFLPWLHPELGLPAVGR